MNNQIPRTVRESIMSQQRDKFYREGEDLSPNEEEEKVRNESGLNSV